MHSINSEASKSADEALAFKAHEAADTLKRILKDCYVNTTDDNDEDCYRCALEELVNVKDQLPEPPKKKLSDEERRRQKENEF